MRTPPSQMPSPGPKRWTSKPLPVRGTCLGADEIGFVSELLEGRVPGHERDLHAGFPRHLGVVGRLVALPLRMRAPDGGKAKALWRLHSDQPVARHRLTEPLAAAG
jgi:hypothetical protein